MTRFFKVNLPVYSTAALSKSKLDSAIKDEDFANVLQRDCSWPVPGETGATLLVDAVEIPYARRGRLISPGTREN